MPIGNLTEAEFEVLCRRAGLPLTAEQAADYWPVYQLVENMAAMVRKPRTHLAEPAHVYAHPREVL